MLVLLRRTSFLTTFYGLYFNQQGVCVCACMRTCVHVQIIIIVCVFNFFLLYAFLRNFFLCQDLWHGDVPPHHSAPCYLNSDKLFLIRAINIVTPSRIQTWVFSLLLCLNIVDNLNRLTTTAGFIKWLWMKKNFGWHLRIAWGALVVTEQWLGTAHLNW